MRWKNNTQDVRRLLSPAPAVLVQWTRGQRSRGGKDGGYVRIQQRGMLVILLGRDQLAFLMWHHSLGGPASHLAYIGLLSWQGRDSFSQKLTYILDTDVPFLTIILLPALPSTDSQSALSTVVAFYTHCSCSRNFISQQRWATVGLAHAINWCYHIPHHLGGAGLHER